MAEKLDSIDLTFVKEHTSGICSQGVLPYTMKDGKPDKPIGHVISCKVESSSEELSIMTLTVYVKEE